MIRTLLAMPGGLLRGALRFVLSTQDDIDVVAEHDTLDDLLAGALQRPPDVTVLDMDLVGPQHAPIGEHPALTASGGRVLLLVDPRRSAVLTDRLAGTRPGIGFLAHSVDPEQVVNGIRRLHRGELVLDADLVFAALQVRNPLTAQEVRVLQTAASGAPVKEIANKLGLSPGTVRNYLSRIIAKTGARTRIEAVHIAQESGWV